MRKEAEEYHKLSLLADEYGFGKYVELMNPMNSGRAFERMHELSRLPNVNFVREQVTRVRAVQRVRKGGGVYTYKHNFLSVPIWYSEPAYLSLCPAEVLTNVTSFLPHQCVVNAGKASRSLAVAACALKVRRFDNARRRCKVQPEHRACVQLRRAFKRNGLPLQFLRPLLQRRGLC